MIRVATIAIVMLAVGTVGGCTPTSPKGFESPDPQERAREGLAAAARGDRSHMADMVELLQNDDSAARLAAIGALRQLTGKDFGYDYLGSVPARAAAIDRWKGWLASEEGKSFAGQASASNGKNGR